MVKMHIEWLKAAIDDLILLSEIENNEHITNLIAFHAHQAVEKSLKALLEFKAQEVPKIHKLQTLIDRTGLSREDDEALVQLLDSLYIESRYPGDMGLLPYGKPTLEDAKEFHAFAKDVFEQVCDLLKVDQKALREK